VLDTYTPFLDGLEGYLYTDLPNSNIRIKVDSDEWFNWLSKPFNTSFTYENTLNNGDSVNFGVSKKDNKYWRAVKQYTDDHRTVYLGMSPNLTLDKLAKASTDINLSKDAFKKSRRGYEKKQELKRTEDRIERYKVKDEISLLKDKLIDLEKANTYLKENNTKLKEDNVNLKSQLSELEVDSIESLERINKRQKRVINILNDAITNKSKGSEYDSSNATSVKRAIEKVLPYIHESEEISRYTKSQG